jgi:hypothetical protein
MQLQRLISLKKNKKLQRLTLQTWGIQMGGKLSLKSFNVAASPNQVSNSRSWLSYKKFVSLSAFCYLIKI